LFLSGSGVLLPYRNKTTKERKIMTKQQLNSAIMKVSKITGETKEEIAKKLFAKDVWTWTMVRGAK
tara:strand:- start:287 stop:484 length:198 start_codon:yes stop_codon:yes gene_type:complete